MRKSWLLVLFILTLCACTVLFAACSYDGTVNTPSDTNGDGTGTTKPARTEFTVVIDDGRTVTTVKGKIGDPVTATAATLANKVFLGWRYEGEMVSTDQSILFAIEGDGALNAVFCNAHTVYLDAGEGEASATYLTVGEGQKYSLPVPTLKHYEFLGWFDGNTAYSDERGRVDGVFSAYEDIYLSAKYEKIPEFSISVVNGTVDDRGNDKRVYETLTVFRGETVTLTAVDVKNMKFLSWENSEGETVSEEREFSFTAVADCKYTAKYKSSYTVIAINGFGGGDFEYLQKVTVSAQTNKRGQKFIGWRNFNTGVDIIDADIFDDDGEKIGEIKNNDDGSITFNVTESVVLEAVYEYIYYKVEYFINGRLLSAEADYVLNEQDSEKKQAFIDYYSRFDVTVAYNGAITVPEYRLEDDPYYDGNNEDLIFGGWADAPAKMPAGNVEILGTVVKATYRIKCLNAFGGGIYEAGEAVTLTPKTLDGKRFVGWTYSDGTPVTEGTVGDNNTLTVIVKDNQTFVAAFEDAD